MTATSTIPTSRSTGHRAVWAAFALAFAAVLAIAAAVAIVVDDGPAGPSDVAPATATGRASAAHVSADAAEARSTTAISTTSAIPVSADAAEARPFTGHAAAAEVTRSADATERSAAAEQARDLRACRYSAAPPDAVERCLNGG